MERQARAADLPIPSRHVPGSTINCGTQESELLAFADSPLGRKYPATVATWENSWEWFIPFLAFPPGLRRIIYTTDEIINPLLG